MESFAVILNEWSRSCNLPFSSENSRLASNPDNCGMPVTQYLNPIYTITSRWRRRIVFVSGKTDQHDFSFHSCTHFLFNRYLCTRNHKPPWDISILLTHFPSPSLSLHSMRTAKSAKKNFFSFIRIEACYERNPRFSLDKKERKKKKTLVSSGVQVETRKFTISILCIFWMLLSPIEEHIDSSIDGGGIGRYRPLEQSETTSLLVARFRVRNAKHAASLLCTRHFNQLVFVQSARYPWISDHRWLVGIVRLYRQRDQIIRERADTLE